jgi:Glycosyltransferase
MKIVISSDMYWPTINGVSTFSRNLAQGMASMGHDVLVLAPSQTGDKYEETDGGCRIVRLASTNFPFYHSQTATLPNRKTIAGVPVPRVYVNNGFKMSLNPQREIKRVLDDFRPDIIHNQQFLMIGQAVLSYATKNNVPVMHTNHVLPENLLDNLRLLAPFSKPIASAMKHYGAGFLRKFDYITMPTQLAIDITIAKHIANNNMNVPVEVVSNGIELTRFSPKKVPDSVYEKYKIPKGVPIISYIGRIDIEKHVPILISAFHRIHKLTDAHLLLVGDGTDMANIKEQIKKLGISKKVILTGRLDRDTKDIVDLHRIGTVFCMPSPADLQSIVTLEAMACGQPVVAIDAGALRELCHDKENGFLCEKDDVNEIGDSLYDIVSDPVLRDKYSKESLKIASSHDLKFTLDRFEKIYKDVIKSTKKR